MADFLDPSNVFGSPPQQQQQQPQPQQGQGSIFQRLQQLLGGAGYSVGGTPVSFGSNGYQVPQIRPTPQMPSGMGAPQPFQPTAPIINPNPIPSFSALAQLRQKLGLPPAPQAGAGMQSPSPGAQQLDPLTQQLLFQNL